MSCSLLTQGIVDTRSLHLWVLSYTSPYDFIIRICQYAALETVGISFGHCKNGAGAVAIGGLRNFVAQELAPTILYNSTKIKAITGLEKNAIAIAALVGKKGRSILPVVLKLIGGHQAESVEPMVLKAMDTQTVPFQKNCKIIIENMFQEQAMRRALQGSGQRIYNNPLVTPTVVSVLSSSSLNILPIIGWTIFGFTLTVVSIGTTLHIFQRAERYRCENIIDVQYKEV